VTVPLGSTPADSPEIGVLSPAVSETSTQMPYVTIVLPCHNEEGHVIAEVARICEAMDLSGYPYELVAYDDASTDSTLLRLQEAAPDYPQLRIVHFHRNGGSGTVRRIGTQQARGHAGTCYMLSVRNEDAAATRAGCLLDCRGAEVCDVLCVLKEHAQVLIEGHCISCFNDCRVVKRHAAVNYLRGPMKTMRSRSCATISRPPANIGSVI